MKGADWHFLLAERTEISHDHTVVSIQASKHCYLRWKTWFASKAEGKQVGFVLSYPKLHPFLFNKTRPSQSYFISQWFARGEHKSAWLDKKPEVE